ncbi:hypothetical protein L596_002322 [Steinernema carpocapsae]|uniref:Protein YIPF n=1 Tax=Steinernema carpocapsae TaxID=34508 RepID=A0A4U8UQS9_STECR|nr:hypothetical protein L596_002322 [Steinernema carpocapsae]
MIPRLQSNFITDFVQPIPDLYGPFWISVTLIFTTGIFGNLSKYVQSSGASGQTFENDFGLITGASTIIALYVLVVPFILYNVIWYRQAAIQYSYLELLCAYGYSLTIFVPVSILWVVDFEWFRWSLIAVSVFLSGAVLANCIWPALKNDSNKMIAFGTIGGILFLHTLLAIGFKEYYFDAVHLSSGEVSRPVMPAKPTSLPALPANPNDTKETTEEAKKAPKLKRDLFGDSAKADSLPIVSGNVESEAKTGARMTISTPLKSGGVKL